jgi:hypothetical protein
MVAAGESSNGHGRNGHDKAASANGVNRLTGDGAAPLEPSATAATPSAPPLASAPDQPKGEGRDSSSGRFTTGNRYGKGNPHARRMAALREAFLSAATEERMRELGEKLFAAAMAGDWQAAKLFLLFVIGRPSDAVNPDTLDREEWLQCQQWPEEPFTFAWLRKRSFAEGVRMLQHMAELGQGEVVRLSLDEPNEGGPSTAPSQ